MTIILLYNVLFYSFLASYTIIPSDDLLFDSKFVFVKPLILLLNTVLLEFIDYLPHPQTT